MTTIGKDGRKIKTYKKKYYGDYVCEPGKKIQQRLSFVKTTPLNKTTLVFDANETQEVLKNINLTECPVSPTPCGP